MTTANAQRTVEEAFPGRFLLGLGVSHQNLVEDLRNHDYSRPLSYMRDYLARMREALFLAHGPQELPEIVLAALGPRMLALSAEAAAGAHPYFVPPEHTAIARDVMGPDAALYPEQMVVLDTDPAAARTLARKNMALYLGLPNYTNNLRRLGFEQSDIDGGPGGGPVRPPGRRHRGLGHPRAGHVTRPGASRRRRRPRRGAGPRRQHRHRRRRLEDPGPPPAGLTRAHQSRLRTAHGEAPGSVEPRGGNTAFWIATAPMRPTGRAVALLSACRRCS